MINSSAVNEAAVRLVTDPLAQKQMLYFLPTTHPMLLARAS